MLNFLSFICSWNFILIHNFFGYKILIGDFSFNTLNIFPKVGTIFFVCIFCLYGLHGFWWDICCYFHSCSLVGKVFFPSGFFQDFLFIGFLQLVYDMPLYKTFGIHPAFSLGSFYWHIFKLIDFFPNHVQSTDHHITGIFHFCYSVLIWFCLRFFIFLLKLLICSLILSTFSLKSP